MARALKNDPIIQLEENLQCSVCLEVLKDPRTLPCCHSFCKDCLEGVVKSCRDQARRDRRQVREFPCPDCRTMFTLEPNKHVADMPRNHFICNMVQVTAVLDRGTRVPCSHNCSQSFSVARCVTCEKFLCRECLTDHDKYRGHHNHSVLTMEELSKPENRSKINGTMYCNEHSGMALKVYCETCDKLICTDCMHFKHIKQNHSCLLVKDVATNYKELLSSNNKAMEDALIAGNVFLQQLSLTMAQLDSNVENTKSEIVQRRDAMAKKVVAMLNLKAETLLNKVGQIHRHKREKLEQQTKETQSYVENIKQSVELSKKLVDQGTEEEIISSQKMMLNNANNLLTKGPTYFKAPIPGVKVNYTLGAASKEALNNEILGAMANTLGEVNDDDRYTGSNQPENKHGQRRPDITLMDEEHDKAKSAKKVFGKETRRSKFDEGPGLNSNQDKTSEAPFNDARGATLIEKLSREVAKNVKPVVYQEQNRYVNSQDYSDELCIICVSDFTNKRTLDKCGHSFCAACIEQAFQHQTKCPLCSQDYGPLIGNQPPGKMIVSRSSLCLSGFEPSGTIQIVYKFEGGVQGPDHPNPGKRYSGTQRVAYLPDNKEGNKVLKLLQKAFAQKLTFTIGRSSTTRATNVITWNDISHKTRMAGGPTNFGYPDPDYLKRVQEELAAKGITE